MTRMRRLPAGPVEVLLRSLASTAAELNDGFLAVSYHWPDLDGVACAVAMREVMSQLGFADVKAGYSQRPQIEAEWAVRRLGLAISPFTEHDGEKLVLVDVSDPADLPPFIQLEKVIGVIDHRGSGNSSAFPRAAIQIEPVAACATVAAELAFRVQAPLQRETIAALYLALMSNSYLLCGTATTLRDRDVAIALREAYSSDSKDLDRLAREMYVDKTVETLHDLRYAIEADVPTKPFSLRGRQCVVAQLELANGYDVLRDNASEIAGILESIRIQRYAEHVWLQVVDLTRGETSFLFTESTPMAIVADHLPMRVTGWCGIVPVMISRKEAVAILNR